MLSPLRWVDGHSPQLKYPRVCFVSVSLLYLSVRDRAEGQHATVATPAGQHVQVEIPAGAVRTLDTHKLGVNAFSLQKHRF